MAGESATLHLPVVAPRLPDGWTWKRLDAVCEGVFDCPHSTPILTDAGPYVVRSQDIRSGHFRRDEAAHVSEDTYQERIARTEPRHGDLLYSREGTYFGIAAEVPRNVRLCLGQRMVLLRPLSSTTHGRFLLYWLNSPLMSSHIHGFRDGSVAERLNLPTIRGLPIALPALPEQRAIAHILGTLDDKIELNRRMNKTMEAMARELFKSWFAGYNPASARADGWKVEEMGRHIDSSRGFSYDGASIAQGGVPFHNLNSIFEGGGYKFEGIKSLSGEFDDRCAVEPGDVIVANTEQGQDRLLLGSAALVPRRYGPRTPFSHHLYRVRIRPGSPLRPVYVLHLLNDPWMHDLVSRYGNGTTVNMLPMDALELPRIAVPPERLVTRFEATVLPLHHRVEAAVLECETLEGLRDALLPGLVSGQLRTKDVSRFMESVAP